MSAGTTDILFVDQSMFDGLLEFRAAGGTYRAEYRGGVWSMSRLIDGAYHHCRIVRGHADATPRMLWDAMAEHAEVGS